MSLPRSVAVASLAASVTVLSCDTGAVAVGDCRTIERARCRAALYCEVGIDSDKEVEICERFARDHCLHGLQVDDDPGVNKVNACVAALEAAADCAKDNDDPDFPASDCSGVTGLRSGVTVCEVINEPEEASQCDFLVPPPPEEDPEEEEPTDPEPDAGADGG